jgi:ferredoxin--NADP+ reductase
LPGVYVTGWLRRGPSGVIGTNRPDAGEVAASVLADVDALPTPEATPDYIDRLLAERAVRVLGWKDWLRLEAHEKEIGDAHGGDPVVMHELDAILRMLDAG